jgi:hypothetical protein
MRKNKAKKQARRMHRTKPTCQLSCFSPVCITGPFSAGCANWGGSAVCGRTCCGREGYHCSIAAARATASLGGACLHSARVFKLLQVCFVNVAGHIVACGWGWSRGCTCEHVSPVFLWRKGGSVENLQMRVQVCMGEPVHLSSLPVAAYKPKCAPNPKPHPTPPVKQESSKCVTAGLSERPVSTRSSTL